VGEVQVELLGGAPAPGDGIVGQVIDRFVGIEAAVRGEELSRDSLGLVRVLGRADGLVVPEPTPGSRGGHGDDHGGGDRGGNSEGDSAALAGVGEPTPQAFGRAVGVDRHGVGLLQEKRAESAADVVLAACHREPSNARARAARPREAWVLTEPGLTPSSYAI
jgi:hypothetical protein